MLVLVKKWRSRAAGIRSIIESTDEVSLDNETRSEQKSIVNEKALTKVASVYEECATELEKELWKA